MTYYYQNQCDNVCYSPCNYGTAYTYRRSYGCGSPCGSRGYGGLRGYRRLYSLGDCCSYGSTCTTRYYYPSCCEYSYGCCYPC